MRVVFLLILTTLLSLAAQDNIFDLERDAPVKEKRKVVVDEETLSDLLQGGEYAKLEKLFDELASNAADKLVKTNIRKIQLKFQLETGLYKEAVTDLEKSPLSDDEECYYLTSEAYRLLGLYEKAFAVVDDARVKYPHGHSLAYQYWHLSKITGNEEKEEAAWAVVKGLYEKTDSGREGTAAELAFIGRAAVRRSPQTAYNLFQRSYKQDPDYLDVYVWAGDHCAEKYAWDFAVEEYSKALAMNPNHPLANAGLAYILMEKGDYQKAKELVDVALVHNPNCSKAIHLKSELLMADEKNYQALRLLKGGLEINQNDLQLLSQLAAVYEQLAEPEKRDEYIAKVLKINSSFSAVYINISQSCENRRQFPMAVKWAKKAMALNPKDWEGYYTAGMNLLRLGEESEGYKILDQAFSLNGFNVWARNILVLLDRDFKKKEYVQFETENFVIKLHRSESEIMWPYLRDVVEAAYDKYTKRYAIKPQGPKEYNGKILLLMFNRHEDFSARTVGLPGLGALGACFGQIITMPSPIIGQADPSNMFNWKRVFEHEFIHVLTLQKSSYRIPRWFTEGISTWEEMDPQSEVDVQLKWAWKNGHLLPLEDINTGFSQQNYPNQIGVSYYQASLIAKYLNDEYGFDVINKMILLYKEGKSNETALEEATGKKLAELNEAVKDYLDKFIGAIPLSVDVSAESMAQLESRKHSFGLNKEQLLDLAEAYIQHEKIAMADELVTPFLSENPDNARANAIKAFILLQGGQKDASQQYFEKVVAIDQTHYAANYFLAIMAEEKGELQRAIGYYNKAITGYPRVPNPANNLYYKVVELNNQLMQKDEALAALKAHTENNNKSFDGFVRYARQLAGQGMESEAIQAFMNANYIFPFDLDVHVECGSLMIKHNRLAEALREFTVANQIEPRHKNSLAGLVEVYILMGKASEARKNLAKLQRFYPDDDFSELEKKLSALD